MFLQELSRRGERRPDGYPFTVPVIDTLDTLTFRAPVTVICGGNGAGKTTLMELLSAGVRAVRVDGGAGPKAEKQRAFSGATRAFFFRVMPRPAHCFFFQAEDFIRYIDQTRRQREEAQRELENVQSAYDHRSEYARSQARMPHARAIAEIDSLYGDMGRRSHGEGFLDFFSARLQPGGLYLLDEPEGALSYENQMVMLALIRRAVAQGSQFILSTHSPVLMGCPDAQILEMDEGILTERSFDQLSSIDFLRRYLNHRDRMMRQFGVIEEDEQCDADVSPAGRS